jgi:hypothetical protein
MAQSRRYDSPAQRQAAYRQRLAQAAAAQLQARGLPALPAPGAIPGVVRWRALLRQAHGALQSVVTEMQQYGEARSQRWQESERGEEFQERLDEVQQLCEALDEFCAQYNRSQ